MSIVALTMDTPDELPGDRLACRAVFKLSDGSRILMPRAEQACLILCRLLVAKKQETGEDVVIPLPDLDDAKLGEAELYGTTVAEAPVAAPPTDEEVPVGGRRKGKRGSTRTRPG